MAKIKQNNYLDTVDEVISSAKQEGVLHLYAEGDELAGRKITIKGEELYHFGTTGYLGLEQDERLKEAAVSAIYKYGTQFPLSKSYISHPLYWDLEEKLTQIYENPIIITKNSTLGHLAAIPTAVDDEDGVILDHQVHWSVQNAAQLLKIRGVRVEMIRHNHLEMLECKIKELSQKCRKIWYMADGVYSMFGDYAPLQELLVLASKYPKLHFYIDDVHGMSWKGRNGAGFVMDELKILPENMLLMGTLSKTFGASGGVLVCPDRKLHSKIKNFGGPLTFSAQLEPASVAAASASADIHLSDEIYELQRDLQLKIQEFNSQLLMTNLPLVEKNDSPVFYIGTGMPVTGYNFVNRLMREGFYVNLGLYPAVPVKNTGVRITVSRHNQEEEMRSLTEAMVYHLPKAMEETNTSLNRVRKAFRLETGEPERNFSGKLSLKVKKCGSISDIEKEEWNALFGDSGCMDWQGLKFLEGVFRNGNRPEDCWTFHYLIVTDGTEPVLATFFSFGLWKDDLLSPAPVSVKLEEQRKEQPYYLTSKVLGMGSLFTEGEHLFLNQQHPKAEKVINELFQYLHELEQRLRPESIVLRDFEEDTVLSKIFHDQGFVKIKMPESCILEDLTWENESAYLARLSSRSRKHFRKEVKPYEEKFEVLIRGEVSDAELNQFYQLYINVKRNNPGLNTFAYPEKLFEEMNLHSHWEFICLYVKERELEGQPRLLVGVMCCYKNQQKIYVPNVVGFDYKYNREYQVYRQLLYQTVKRARQLDFTSINFGMTAAFEKKKLGAKVINRYAYLQGSDNFSQELLETLSGQDNYSGSGSKKGFRQPLKR